MTADLIAEIVASLREKLEKATSGPWQHYNEVFRKRLGRRRVTEIQRKDGKPIINWMGFDGLPAVIERKITANATLVVAAVNALPILLDALTATQARAEELEGEIAHLEKVVSAREVRLIEEISISMKYAARATAAEAEIERLRKFVRHDGLCGIVGGYGRCTCGLDALLGEGGAGHDL